jgi:hypothetical protein
MKKDDDDDAMDGVDEDEDVDRSTILLPEDGQQLFDAIARSFYQGRKDIGVGIRRQKLRALGLIAERFPEILKGVCSQIGRSRTQVLVELLESNIKTSENDKKEQQVLTGCLEAISYGASVDDFVSAFFGRKPENVEKIFGCIFAALEELVAGNMNRYHLPIAALQLFASHTEFFSDVMAKPIDQNKLNVVSMCKMLLESCRHHNKDVSSKALKAYEAFLGSVRSTLIGNRNVVSQLCAQFHDLLQADPRAKCLSLRGYGSLASAIKSVESNEVLSDLWIRLAAYMESVLGRGEELEREEVTMQLPTLIVAFADILLVMEQVSPL